MRVVHAIPRIGDIGEDTKVVQEALKAQGFAVGTIDRIFGGKTKQAVSACQKANGLPGSGIIGPKTLEILGIVVRPIVPSTGEKTITKDLVGKKGRKLHPTLRVLMEEKIFPNGRIPDAFIDQDVQQMVILTSIGLESLAIREVGGNNRGNKVGLIQDIIGPYASNGTGDAWCMSTVQVVIAFIEDFIGVESPVLDSEGVTVTWKAAQKIPGLFTETPEVGTAFALQYGTKWQGHTGTVLQLLAALKMRTFEGNTGADSIRDGSGAFFRTRGQKTFGGTTVVRGFIRVYPYNKVPRAA